jgi:hypothetical protein
LVEKSLDGDFTFARRELKVEQTYQALLLLQNTFSDDSIVGHRNTILARHDLGE